MTDLFSTACQPSLHYDSEERKKTGRRIRQVIQERYRDWHRLERGRVNRERHAASQSSKYERLGRGYSAPAHPADQAREDWKKLSDAYGSWAGTCFPRLEYTDKHRAVLESALSHESWRSICPAANTTAHD